MNATTRRAALRGSIAALAATPVLAIAAPAADPILEAYRRYRALQREAEPIDARLDVIRAGLVERCGEVSSKRPADIFRAHDPARAELCRLNEESDRLSNELIVPTDEIIETPATTLQGLLAKLRVALDLWPPASADLDYHEEAALAVLKDAVRLLEGAA
jgi:hypothetical protein